MRVIILFFISILFLSLEARENPFKPVITPKESGLVSKPQKSEFFVSEEIRLPSSARKIKKILIEYQNMDGTIKSVYKNLDNDIDWHFPIIISQDIVLDSGTNLSQEYKIMVPPQISENRQKFSPLPFLSFEINGKSIHIITDDIKIRDFALAEPTKIVVDLERKVDFQSKFLKTDAPYFEEIAIGNHKNYYRVAIRLDGKYRYEITDGRDGYKIELR